MGDLTNGDLTNDEDVEGKDEEHCTRNTTVDETQSLTYGVHVINQMMNS